MSFLYPGLGLAAGLLLMVAAYYFYACFSWLHLRKLVWDSLPVNPADAHRILSTFIAYRVEMGSSFFTIRDCFLRVTSYADGISLQPWLPLPRSSCIFLSWPDLSSIGTRPHYHLLGATVVGTSITIWVTPRQLEILRNDGFGGCLHRRPINPISEQGAADQPLTRSVSKTN